MSLSKSPNSTTFIHLLASACLIAPALTQAAPDHYHDARSSAMGFTGVASSRSVGSLVQNPALLAAPHRSNQDAWGLTVPSFGVSALVDDDLADDVDNFQNNRRWDTLEQAITDLDTAATGGNEAQIRSSLQTVIDVATVTDSDLTKLDNSAARASGGALIGYAQPSPTFGIGVHATTALDAFALTKYRDSAQLNNLIDTGNTLLAGDPTTIDINDFDLTADPESEGEVVGMAVTEVGVTLARQFQIGGADYQFGITPKYQEIRSFYYIANADNLDESDFEASDQESSTSGFNMDIGASRQFGDQGQYHVGLVVRNLLKKDLLSVQVTDALNLPQQRTLTLEPQATVGLAYIGESWTFAADLDLNANKASTFEEDRQYLALGAEYDMAQWFQVRGGLRHNLAGGNAASSDLESDTGLTFGLGFSPGWFHVDLSTLYADNEYGALLEIGFQN